jgi:hypothetical protein
MLNYRAKYGFCKQKTSLIYNETQTCRIDKFITIDILRYKLILCKI